MIDDILILENNYQNILESYNQIELDKNVDFILSEYAILDIENFSKLYNTTQIFNQTENTNNKVSKFKTEEHKEEIRAKREESKSNKQLEMDKYFEVFEFSDYEIEKIYKFLKDVPIANLTKFVSKAIEDKKDYLRARFENIRTSKDFKIFVTFHLDFLRFFLELLKKLEHREYITVSELVEKFTQAGHKLSARGSFKDEIQHLCEFIGKATLYKWEYAKKTKINGKSIYNSIKRNFSDSEVILIKYLKDNQVKDLDKFINWSDKSLSQLVNTYREEIDGLNRVIENYLDVHLE